MPARRIFVSANPPPVPPPPPPSLGGTPSLSLNAPSRGGFLGGRPKLLLSVGLVVLLTGGGPLYLVSPPRDRRGAAAGPRPAPGQGGGPPSPTAVRLTRTVRPGRADGPVR